MKNTTNYTWIMDNYKSSTYPRLKELMGYKNTQDLIDCPYLTYARLYHYNPRFVQDCLFDFLNHCVRTGKMADSQSGLIIKNPTYNAFVETLDVFDLTDF